MQIKSVVSGLIDAACTALSAPSQATILFSDNFDTDNTTSVLNVATVSGVLSNWTVSNGTVDYIATPNGYGISCYGGIGGCIDMDGTTGDAGRITSKATFTLYPGVNYYLEAQVSGNQRGGHTDAFDIGLTDEYGIPLAYATYGTIYPEDGFASYSFGFTSGTELTVRLFFEGYSGVGPYVADNVGVILDNVSFRDDASGVPEPATLALFGLGRAGLGFARRRKQ